MLRGTLSKRDRSVCALCRYRIALQQPTLSRSRLFSVSTAHSNENDPNRTGLFRPFSRATGAPTTPGFSARRPVDNFLLNAHESKARESLIARKVDQPSLRPPGQQPRLQDESPNSYSSARRGFQDVGQPIRKPQVQQPWQLENSVFNPYQSTPQRGSQNFRQPSQQPLAQQPLRLDESRAKDAIFAHRYRQSPTQPPVHQPRHLDNSSFNSLQSTPRQGFQDVGQPTQEPQVQQHQRLDNSLYGSQQSTTQGPRHMSRPTEQIQDQQYVRRDESLFGSYQSTPWRGSQNGDQSTRQPQVQQSYRLDGDPPNNHEMGARQGISAEKGEPPVSQLPSQQARPFDDARLNPHEMRDRQSIFAQKVEPRIQQHPVQQPSVQQSPVQQPQAQPRKSFDDMLFNTHELRARQSIQSPVQQSPVQQSPVQQSPVQQPQAQPRKSFDDMLFNTHELRARQSIQSPVQQPPVQQPRAQPRRSFDDMYLNTHELRARQSIQSPVQQSPIQQPQAQHRRSPDDMLFNTHELRARQSIQSPVQQPPVQQPPVQQPRAQPRTSFDDMYLNTHELRARQSIQSPVQQSPVQQPPVEQSPVQQPRAQPRKSFDDMLLNTHELRARQSILANNAGRQVGQNQMQSPLETARPEVNARYVWDPERQRAIEGYLQDESMDAYAGSNSNQKWSRVSRNDAWSASLRNTIRPMNPTTDTYADPASRQRQSQDASLARVQSTSPASQHRSHPAYDSRNRGSAQSWSSNFKQSNEFSGSLKAEGNFYRTTPGPSRVAYDSRLQTDSPQSKHYSEPQMVSSHTMREDFTHDSEKSQEWGQLARKPAKQNLANDYWHALEQEADMSQPSVIDDQTTEPVSLNDSVIPTANSVPESDKLLNVSDAEIHSPPDNQDTKLPSPDPSKTNNAPVLDSSNRNEANSQTSSPKDPWSMDDGYRRDQNRENQFTGRGQSHGKGRGGKSSRRDSRFLDDDGQDHYEDYLEKRRRKEERKAQRKAERTEPIPIILPELISITAFADALRLKPEDFLVQLGQFGFEGVTLDSLMAGETAALVAQEYGYDPIVDAGGSQDLKPRPPPDEPWTLPSRPPVVTIMGHVDHGKTTILDYLRKSSVAAQEHGGITQHIGAFSMKLSAGKQITFLDTPGHAAFLAMRQRGANVTDIIVLVVAADDGVKPQTIEALKHASAAKVPIIVAINKIDTSGSNIDVVKHDLAQHGVEIEDFGGDVQVVCVSARTGQGMADLEENILALSEVLDHRADLDGPAEGWILESSLKLTGKVATVLVKRGTLRPGDHVAAGLTWAKIRQLRNEAGMEVTEAPPGTPVEVFGWKDLPAAGDQVIQSPDENRAKTAVSYRQGLRAREKDAAEYENIAETRRALQEKRAREKAATEGDADQSEDMPEEENGAKIINFVVKGDVHGSVEAVCAAIQEIGNHEVRPRILRSATGPISEYDVEHAATSKSILVNFATETAGNIVRLAAVQGVRILEHNIIYHVIDDVKASLSAHLAPDESSRVLGDAEVLEIFPINIHGRVYKNIAGCRVRNGLVGKNHLYRVIRNGKTIFDGKIETLKNIQKDVMEMRKGSECGIGFDGFQDLAVGDQIQSYEKIFTQRKLE